MKKIISMLLVLMLICTFCTPAFAVTDQSRDGGICGALATYALFSDGELWIAPEGGRSGAEINNRAFRGRSEIVDVVIENGIAKIGEEAFSDCKSLRTIELPDSVTSIGQYAFSACRLLETVAIPDSVTSIEMFTFSGCSSLRSIVLPNSVASIDMYAFRSCQQLESVTICNGEATIWDSAFEYCSNNLTIISQSRGYNKVEGYAARNGIAFEEIDDTNGTASILSDGILWIIIAVAVVAVGGVVALIIVKKKTAIAGGAENTDEK